MIVQTRNALLSIIEYAKNKIPYYKDILKFLEVDIRSMNISDLLNAIPIISKSQIKSNILSFISSEIDNNSLLEIVNLDKDYKKEYWYNVHDILLSAEYTSGSSGSPFLSIKSKNERLLLGNKLWKIRNKFSNIQPNEMFMFIHNFYGNDYPFPFDPPKEYNDRVIKEIEFLAKSNYKWWHATTIRLEEYSIALMRNRFEFPNLCVIENNGTYISDEEKVKYCSIFDCKIANNYGCREVWTIAYDCANGDLHVNEDNVYLELVDENGSVIVEPNRIGNVVVTSLKQKIMPFIRYRLDDYAYYISGVCECGNSNKRIRLLPGRNLISGTNLYGNQYFKNIILKLIKQYQVRNFESISIVQTDESTFKINIKGNKESRDMIERNFIESAKSILTNFRYSYIFSYNDNLDVKDLFSVKYSKSIVP